MRGIPIEIFDTRLNIQSLTKEEPHENGRH